MGMAWSGQHRILPQEKSVAAQLSSVSTSLWSIDKYSSLPNCRSEHDRCCIMVDFGGVPGVRGSYAAFLHPHVETVDNVKDLVVYLFLQQFQGGSRDSTDCGPLVHRVVCVWRQV